jgi:hypothetical protein
MGQCHLRENDSDVRDFAKYDGTMEGLKAVQSILPRGWSSNYTITGDGVTSCCLTKGGQQFYLAKEPATFLVVDRFDTLELHDSSSFYYLFEDGKSEPSYDIMADGILWGG